MWLRANPGSTKNDIKTHFLKIMEDGGLKEYWQKHYFLASLQKYSDDFSPEVNQVIKELDADILGVPMYLRYIAFHIDLFVIGAALSVLGALNIFGDGIMGFVALTGYFAYFVFSTYKYNATLGQRVFRIRVQFNSRTKLIRNIFLREILFLTLLTGLGFILFLIDGSYWDRALGAKVVWTRDNG